MSKMKIIPLHNHVVIKQQEESEVMYEKPSDKKKDDGMDMMGMM